jgi:dihydroorotase-like cyclic amidohydrolase
VTTTLVRGGQLVDELSIRRADLLIEEGRVRAILPAERAQAARSDQVIDASGLHVLPGLVDAHVHFNEPGRTDWEGFLTGTTAAAAGGITTVCDMPLNSHPPTLDARSLNLKRSAIAQHAVVDYALWGGLVPESLEHAAETSCPSARAAPIARAAAAVLMCTKCSRAPVSRPASSAARTADSSVSGGRDRAQSSAPRRPAPRAAAPSRSVSAASSACSASSSG